MKEPIICKTALEAEETAREKEKAEKALTKTNNTANAEHTNVNKTEGEKTMKNTTRTTNTNITATAENNTTKGEKNMKKTIKEIRAEELKAREEAEAEAREAVAEARKGKGKAVDSNFEEDTIENPHLDEDTAEAVRRSLKDNYYKGESSKQG